MGNNLNRYIFYRIGDGEWTKIDKNNLLEYDILISKFKNPKNIEFDRQLGERTEIKLSDEELRYYKSKDLKSHGCIIIGTEKAVLFKDRI